MLWGWGLSNDNIEGIVDLPARRVAGICDFRGDADEFLASLTKTGWLLPTENEGVFRMRGWERNASFFKERERLRNRYQREKSAAGFPRDSRGKVAGKSRPSYTFTYTKRSKNKYVETPLSERTLILEASPAEAPSANKFALSPQATARICVTGRRVDAASIEAVLSRYTEHFPARHRQASSPKVRKLVARWLEKYSVEELRDAIDGCLMSRYHQEHNYTHLTLIFRDEVHIDRFGEFKRNGPPPETAGEAAVRGVVSGPIIEEAEGSLWDRMRKNGESGS